MIFWYRFTTLHLGRTQYRYLAKLRSFKTTKRKRIKHAYTQMRTSSKNKLTTENRLNELAINNYANFLKSIKYISEGFRKGAKDILTEVQQDTQNKNKDSPALGEMSQPQLKLVFKKISVRTSIYNRITMLLPFIMSSALKRTAIDIERTIFLLWNLFLSTSNPKFTNSLLGKKGYQDIIEI